MSKEKKLEKLENEIEEDSSLPLADYSNLVFGEGSADAQVLFIGEAPGYHEDKQGRPFVGRSGQLLNTFLEEIGWDRDDVYITNIVKRRPPENRDPTPDEITAYKPYLTEQISIIDPKVIAPLGRFAMEYFLPNRKISKVQGSIFWMKDKIIFPIYHPAAALRSTGVKKDTQKSFLKLQKVVDQFTELLKTRHADPDTSGMKKQDKKDPEHNTHKSDPLF